MCSSAPACVVSLRRGASSPPRGVPTISSEVETLCDPGPPRCCVVTTGVLPAITRTQDIEEGESSRPEPFVPRFQQQPPTTSTQPAAKSSKALRTSGWKTSKFFSKTMSSGEILRGLKKLSLTSSTATEPAEADQQARPRKSKSGQLKKRSSCGNDDQLNDDEKARSPRSPGSFRPLSKAMSLSEPGSANKSAGLGIVCKKEDLKAILCTATSKKFPLCSPRKRNRQLRQTKSASFEPASDEVRTKEPVRRAGSEETRTRRFEHNETKVVISSDAAALEPPQVPVVDSPAVADMNVINVTEFSSVIPDVEPPRDKGTAVKWDECEVVDAVIIGDAIESFLKGSMCDKRVSFRRQHSDRKTKSDG